MSTTQLSLLMRMRSRDFGDTETWARFVNIYAPLLEEWARRLRVPDQDRQDLIQETLVKLLTKIETFQPGQGGTFRGWLHAILKNTWLDRLRRRPAPETADLTMADPSASDPQVSIERDEYRQYLLRRVFNLLIAEFPEKTQLAFKRYVLDCQPAAQVSADLGISTNALYLIRSRIIKRLQAELSGLVDD